MARSKRPELPARQCRAATPRKRPLSPRPGRQNTHRAIDFVLKSHAPGVRGGQVTVRTSPYMHIVANLSDGPSENNPPLGEKLLIFRVIFEVGPSYQRPLQAITDHRVKSGSPGSMVIQSGENIGIAKGPWRINEPTRAPKTSRNQSKKTAHRVPQLYCPFCPSRDERARNIGKWRPAGL